jgi:aspartate aminotransferase
MTRSAVGRVSRRIAQISPSATVSVDQRAKALSAQGMEVFNLSAGEPDFPTPPHILGSRGGAA